MLLVLSGCASHKECWVYHEVISHSAQFNSAQMLFPSQNTIAGIGVELLHGTFGTVGYLNVICRQIPTLPDHLEVSTVVLQIEDQQFFYTANRMEGGQRLLLPQEATEKLIAALHQSQSVTIYLDGYVEEIKPGKFTKYFRKFIADSGQNAKF